MHVLTYYAEPCNYSVVDEKGVKVWDTPLSCSTPVIPIRSQRQEEDAYCPEADPGGAVFGGLTPPKDCPADSEIWRKGVADRL